MVWKKLILIIIIAIAVTSFMTSEPKEKKEYDAEEVDIATFAGGCFWCMESAFEKVEGVHEVVSGFTGGEKVNPSYKEVSSKKTGHVEAILITFSPSEVTYKALLDVFWKSVDPTDAEGQFVDRGSPYTSAIFYHSEEQKKLAEISKKELEDSKRFKKPIVTKILPAKEFYAAEEYHQDFHVNHPIQYKFYTANSGREKFYKEHWEEDQ